MCCSGALMASRSTGQQDGYSVIPVTLHSKEEWVNGDQWSDLVYGEQGPDRSIPLTCLQLDKTSALNGTHYHLAPGWRKLPLPMITVWHTTNLAEPSPKHLPQPLNRGDDDIYWTVRRRRRDISRHGVGRRGRHLANVGLPTQISSTVIGTCNTIIHPD